MENVFLWTNLEDHHHWQSLQFVHELLQHSNWMISTWWAYLTSGGCIFHAGIHRATIGERLLRTYKTTHITTSWTLANALLCIYTNSVVVHLCGGAPVWWCTCVVVHLCGGAGHQTYYVIIDNDTLYFDLFPMVEWHQQVVSTLSYPGLLWMKSCTWTHDVQESTISILWILCKSKLMVQRYSYSAHTGESPSMYILTLMHTLVGGFAVHGHRLPDLLSMGTMSGNCKRRKSSISPSTCRTRGVRSLQIWNNRWSSVHSPQAFHVLHSMRNGAGHTTSIGIPWTYVRSHAPSHVL